jgi:hypothetical protein
MWIVAPACESLVTGLADRFEPHLAVEDLSRYEVVELPELRQNVLNTMELALAFRVGGQELRPVVVDDRRVAAINEAAVERGTGGVGVTLDQGDHLLDRTRRDDVIGAEKPAPLCLSHLDHGQQVGRNAPIRVVAQVADSAAADALSEVGNHLGGFVPRGVVRHANLDALVARDAGGERVKRASQERPSAVMGRYADGEEHAGGVWRARLRS